MALQGTIDTFPLADVLTLVASSARSGQLTLTGDRGIGRLWIDKDMVVAGELTDDRILAPQRAVFELLRFEDGSFVFESVDPGDFPDLGTTPVATEECLDDAATMIREWNKIRAVVPGGAHRVCLVTELPDEEMTIDADTWRTLVTITRSSSVDHLAVELGVDEYECAVVVAGLVERGLVEINDPWDLDALLAQGAIGDSDDVVIDGRDTADPFATGPVGLDTVVNDIASSSEDLEQGDAPWPPNGPTPAAVAFDDAASPGTAEDFPGHFPIDDLIPDISGGAQDPWANGTIDDGEPDHDRIGSTAGQAAWDTAEPKMIDPNDGHLEYDETRSTENLTDIRGEEEVLRQMSTLSPSAAEAIAATLTNDTEPYQEPSEPTGGRRGRGLFRGSGLFGGQRTATQSDPDVLDVDDSHDVDPFADGTADAGPEQTEHPGSPDVVATELGSDTDDTGTSISYLDSF